MKNIIGARQWKFPRVFLPFNPALYITSVIKTAVFTVQETKAQFDYKKLKHSFKRNSASVFPRENFCIKLVTALRTTVTFAQAKVSR